MEELVRQLSQTLALAISAIAVLIVGWGSLEAFVSIVRATAAGRTTHGARKSAWRRFGTWLLLGLEFELAADIIQTVIAPEWMDIGELGAIAAVRTFLNYFLEKDLREARGSDASTDVVLQPDGR